MRPHGPDFSVDGALREGGGQAPARYAPAMVASGIAMAVVLLLIIPIGVMLGGAAWSALMGFVLSEDAADRAGEA
jgi:hypothetical protein